MLLCRKTWTTAVDQRRVDTTANRSNRNQNALVSSFVKPSAFQQEPYLAFIQGGAAWGAITGLGAEVGAATAPGAAIVSLPA